MASEIDHPGNSPEEGSAPAEFSSTVTSSTGPEPDTSPADAQGMSQVGPEKMDPVPPIADPISAGKAGSSIGNLDFILDVPLELTVELGRTKMMIHDLLKLGQGSVVELSKLAGETLDILANRRLIARGEVVVVNEKYGIRITEITSPFERVERLR